MGAPVGLRVEHLDEPLGLTVTRPRLSWQLPDGANRQRAYRIRAGQWDSGRVESDQSVLVPYAGPALRPGQRVEWTVQVWTEAGESGWSPAAWWEMGLLDGADWTVSWVGPPQVGEVGDSVSGEELPPVWYLRGSVVLPGRPRRARLYATALGVYEFFINGVRVGDAELTPGFTAYHSRLQVRTFDVTGLLTAGENVLGAVVSGGWVAWAPVYRDRPVSLLAQVEALDSEGRTVRAGTGPDWMAGSGPIRAADLQRGQVSDFRRGDRDWCRPGSDMAGWVPVATRELGFSQLAGSPAPPVRRVEEITPVSIRRPKPDRQVVDLGQNINGWVRLSKLGDTGAELLLTHGEVLDGAGDVTLANVSPPDQPVPFQQDRVVSAGRDGDTFEPRHATKGFRYVRVEGHPGDLLPSDLTGVVVHTDMRRIGWFSCSNERLNRLHDAVVWTLRGNTCDIPTDCPTRERAGWTGDWQTFVTTAAFLYDVAGLTTKWLADLAADQLPDGLVRHCAPEFTALETQIGHGMPPGCAGFGDAAVIVPWEIYQAYGDRDLLAAQWPSMVAWVEYAARRARDHRHPDRIAARPLPAPHEQYLWDTGFHWGEWNEPGMPLEYQEVQEFMRSLRYADHGNVATAYLHHSATILASVAEVIGDERAAARYRDLGDATQRAWRAEFLGPDGTITPHTQASYVRALAFGLVPDELRKPAAAHLVDLVRGADNHVGTGFLATGYLLPVLADNGYLDVAYDLLLQETQPSWIAMINSGATTVWEHWSALDHQGRPPIGDGPGVGSLNHYSKGSVASFLHRYVSGLEPHRDPPGYRRFTVAPRPGGRLTSASTAHDSPYGRISVSWQIHDDRFALDLTVPPGTTASVSLPDGRSFEAGPGEHHDTCRLRA